MRSTRKQRLKRKKPRRKKDDSYHHTTNQIKSAVSKFRSDNSNLKERIHLLQTTVPITARVSKRIQNMRDKQIELEGKVRKIHRRVSNLTGRLKSISGEYEEERKGSGGVHYLKQERHKVQYQLRVLENRLEQVMSKYNQSIAKNRKLKQSIGTIREEKTTFERIYQKMEVELRQWKEKISELIELSNHAHEAKEDSAKDVSLIKEYKKGILHDLNRQFKAMDRLAEKTEAIQERIRRAAELENEGDTGGDTRRSSLSINMEDDYRVYTPRKRKVLAELGEGGDGSSDEEGDGEQEAESYDLPTLFSMLHDELGLEPQEIVSSLEDTENQNFSLYIYYNELHNEITKLEMNIKEMKGEIDNYERGEIKREEKKLNRMYQGFQRQISEAVVNAKIFEDKVSATTDVITEFLSPLKKLFEELDCDKSIIISNQGKFEATQGNVLLILALIEDKIDQIVSYYHWKNKKRKKVVLKIPDSDRKRIKIKPPSSLVVGKDSYGEVAISEMDEPLTIDEMVQKLKRMI